MPSVVPFINLRLELPRGWIYDVEEPYDVTVVRRGRSREVRNLNAEYPRIRINVTIPRDRIADIPYVRRFWRVCKGRATSFLVRDPTDYLSTDQGYRADDEDPQVSPIDQPLIEHEDSPGTYSLVKQYVIGEGTDAVAEHRYITRPVEGTIVVANTAGEEQPSTAWQIDYTTGVLIPNETFVGTPGWWGGEFNVRMRFDSELPRRVEDFRIDEASFSLIEELE